MLKKDIAAAHAAWIAESTNDEERLLREKSSFLKYVNDQGQLRRLPRPPQDVHHEPVAGSRLAQDRPTARPPFGHQPDDDHLHDSLRARSGGAVEALPPIPAGELHAKSTSRPRSLIAPAARSHSCGHPMTRFEREPRETWNRAQAAYVALIFGQVDILLL